MLSLLSLLVGIVGFAYGLRCWLELRRWAHLIKYGRIVVAYKSKVKLNAPLQEWALWAKMAESDKSTNGRVIYTLGGTRIAILRKSFVPDSRIQRLIYKLTRPEGKKVKAGKRSADGTWTAQDETVKG